MPFRTTISLVVWTETVEESEAMSDDVKATIETHDEGAGDSVLSTVEYFAAYPEGMEVSSNGDS